MRTAEQGFKAYYASMTDSDLLAVARNRISFIPPAQAQLAEELQSRQLAVPSEAPSETDHPATLLTKLFRGIRHEPHKTI
jgi:hypothetical protein